MKIATVCMHHLFWSATRGSGGLAGLFFRLDPHAHEPKGSVPELGGTQVCLSAPQLPPRRARLHDWCRRFNLPDRLFCLEELSVNPLRRPFDRSIGVMVRRANDRSLRRKKGSAGSDNCDIANEFGSRSENLAGSLQNLHRGFDSRRRLSFKQIARIRGPRQRFTRPLSCDRSARGGLHWRLARAAQKSAGKRQRSARQRSAVCDFRVAWHQRRS